MKVEIKIKAYEAPLVDAAAKRVIEIATQAGSKISGPVPMPTRREVVTVLRSVHVNKTSREQFETRTHKRLIVLEKVDAKQMEALKRLDLPSGVHVEVVTKE